MTHQPLTLAGYRLAYRDSSGVLIYLNLDTSALNTVGLQPVPAENLSRGAHTLDYSWSGWPS